MSRTSGLYPYLEGQGDLVVLDKKMETATYIVLGLGSGDLVNKLVTGRIKVTIWLLGVIITCFGVPLTLQIGSYHPQVLAAFRN